MMKKDDSKAKADMVMKRYGNTLGDSKGSKPAPKATVKPTGNPFKGKIGVKITKKF